jgi:mannose-6-phosphate isomerase-like protein (cupin superfamily)
MTSAAIMRAADAVVLSSASQMWLLLDSSDTGGAVSTHRVLLRDGAEGAGPHRHILSAEMFYVLSGAVDVLVGEEVLQVIEGDLVVVPAGVDHAFGATAGADGDLLVAVTPGVERFAFFRSVHAVITGKADPSILAGSEEDYDIHPASARALEVWQLSRSDTPHPKQGD